jgi:DNA modification methylase
MVKQPVTILKIERNNYNFEKIIKNFSNNENNNSRHYLNTILGKSNEYLQKTFDKKEYNYLLQNISYIYNFKEKDKIISEFCKTYYSFVKYLKQKEYKFDLKTDYFINNITSSQKIIWGDCYKVLKKMKNESIHCMVTSPPYYNAREYSQWNNLDSYLKDMELILTECYRVLDNHRVFIFNVGDIFDNDNLYTTSVWGKRRLPLGAYFINLFEKIGFTFVDDIIWDKGEVQSERHKNGDRPYPFYQYPMNCYEHLLIFHKHRLDMTRYPCPVCGTLNVNGNSYTEKGLKSWECKNLDCFVRSESNRGKRFSAKTYNTQSVEKNFGSEIEKDFVYKWRRDITKIKPVIKINCKGKNILGHTAPFPADIPEFAVKMFSYVGEKVLDPFSGLGTSIKVASELNRIGVGIEKDLSLKDSVYKFLNKNKISELTS